MPKQVNGRIPVDVKRDYDVGAWRASVRDTDAASAIGVSKKEAVEELAKQLGVPKRQFNVNENAR